jgi:septum formation inhibitor-activating ATPase MinD
VLVVFQPPVSQLRDGDRLKAEHRHVARFHLGVGLRCDAPGDIATGADARAAADAMLVVTEVPDLAAQVAADAADAE